MTYSHLYYKMLLPLGPIFSLEKETTPGGGASEGANVKIGKHFFFGEGNYSRGVVLQREQISKLVNIFSLEKELLQGGGVPEGAKCKKFETFFL